MNISRRFFIGGAASFGAFGGCRFFECHDFRAGGSPNVKFGVVSDIHITNVFRGDHRTERHGGNATFRHTLEWFRDQGVDAVLIAGDMADLGLSEQLEAVAAAWYDVFPDDLAPDGRKVEKVFVYGNHDWEGHTYGDWAQKTYPDPKELERHVMRWNHGKFWEDIFHEEFTPIYRKEIKGYSFIGSHWTCGNTSLSDWNAAYRDFARIRPFMEANGDALDPSLPFFYVQHPHPKDTCYGPWAWGHDDGAVTKCLSAYPNAIAFSGHSHYTLTDERSFWQGAFTSVGTSSLRYTGMPYNERHPVGYENTTTEAKDAWKYDAVKLSGDFPSGDCRQGMLWSVYDDCIVVKRREFVSDLDLGDDWVMPLPAAEPKPFAFAERARKSKAPHFAPDARLSVVRQKIRNRGGKSGDGKTVIAATEKDAFRISVPATVADKDARLYEFEFLAEGRDGTKRVKYVIAEGFNHAPNHPKAQFPSWCAFALDDLPKGEVRFTVTPMNCFHRRGEPLVSDWVET